LRIYDKGVLQEPAYSSFGEFQHVVRTGEVRLPPIKGDEPLRAQVRHFAAAIADGRRPLSDGWDGVRVVSVMDAIQRSLRSGGAHVLPALFDPVPRSLSQHEHASTSAHEHSLTHGVRQPSPTRGGAERKNSRGRVPSSN
jgi:hypothetical protein